MRLKEQTIAIVMVAGLLAGPSSAFAKGLLIPAIDITIDTIHTEGFRGHLASDQGQIKRGEKLTGGLLDLWENGATLCLNHVYADEFEMVPKNGDCFAVGYLPLLKTRDATIAVDESKLYRPEIVTLGVTPRYERDFGFIRE